MDRNSPFEKALRAMKQGSSLRVAAKEHRVSPELLRRHVKRHTTARYERRGWVIFDLRPQSFWIASRGELRQVVLAVDDASRLGSYWAAVQKFLANNDIDFLDPFIGDGVRDVNGRFHPFETGPNTLRKLDSIGELNFIDIYADVAK
jgi:hypothetical protein